MQKKAFIIKSNARQKLSCKKRGRRRKLTKHGEYHLYVGYFIHKN